LDAYIAGADEPLLLGAVSEEPVLLSSVDAAEEAEISEETSVPVLDVVEMQSQVLQESVVETTAEISPGSPKSRKRGKVTA
jgi:hypothetical protein